MDWPEEKGGMSALRHPGDVNVPMSSSLPVCRVLAAYKQPCTVGRMFLSHGPNQVPAGTQWWSGGAGAGRFQNPEAPSGQENRVLCPGATWTLAFVGAMPRAYTGARGLMQGLSSNPTCAVWPQLMTFLLRALVFISR